MFVPAVPFLIRRVHPSRRPSKIAGPKSSAVKAATCLLALGLSAQAAIAQNASRNELSDYTNAVARAQAADRLSHLEQFSMSAQPGPLKIEALQFVIWQHLRNHDFPQALTWANALQSADKDNSLALAVISDHARNTWESRSTPPKQLLAMARQGLDALPRLQRPLGMSPADFAELRQQTQAMLTGAAGWAQLQRKDYADARSYLRQAVALDPDNAPNDYALALADLDGPNADLKEGYWYLAKSVNLSQATPQGAQIAQFARARYTKDGGGPEAWNQFLAATATPGTNGAPAFVSASVSRPALPANPSPPALPPASKSAALTPKAPGSAGSIWADNTIPEPPVVRKHRVAHPGGPLSLGILIETSLTSKENRTAMVDALTDMLRHLGDNDEAFILTYDRNLVFEQDLTSDPHQLEQAMENIKPQKGAVLDDAIAFAAGHLARIAQHPNRVLLVISDGRNVDSHSSPLQTSAEINAAAVRIYCIGMDVSESASRYQLQALSSSTGGRSDFVSDPKQFRNATRDIAQNMGVDFRF